MLIGRVIRKPGLDLLEFRNYTTDFNDIGHYCVN
jgi:hypothetical protein